MIKSYVIGLSRLFHSIELLLYSFKNLLFYLAVVCFYCSYLVQLLNNFSKILLDDVSYQSRNLFDHKILKTRNPS